MLTCRLGASSRSCSPFPKPSSTTCAAGWRRTRWPEAETVDDWSQGIPLAYVQELCALLGRRSTTGARARRGSTRSAQFRTEIDGLGIHFLHVRSPHEDALPLMLTHGWPGSVVEFLEVIGRSPTRRARRRRGRRVPRRVPVAARATASATSRPRPGWGVERIAAAWAELMARLGYDRYGAQGGDWGAIVTTTLGRADAEHVAGIHLNMPLVSAHDVRAVRRADRRPSRRRSARYAEHRTWGTGYSKQQSTRPQTLGYGLVDSPAGQCAWIVEKFWAWTDCDGHPENVSRATSCSTT